MRESEIKATLALPIIPAKAGIQHRFAMRSLKGCWTPASAGVRSFFRDAHNHKATVIASRCLPSAPLRAFPGALYGRSTESMDAGSRKSRPVVEIRTHCTSIRKTGWPSRSIVCRRTMLAFVKSAGKVRTSRTSSMRAAFRNSAFSRRTANTQGSPANAPSCSAL